MARKKSTKKTTPKKALPVFEDPQSRNEAILQNILGANNVLEAPQSRNEAILQAILNGTSYTEAPQSRTEELLLCILNGTTTDMVPQSRNEEILVAKINGGSYDEAPQSRIEELLIQWLNATPAYVEKTVTGNPISIADAIAAEAVALSVALEPIQDLNGYESPWPAGGGKNKFDPSVYSEYVQSDGKYRAKASYITQIQIPIPSSLLNTPCTFSFYADLTNAGTLTDVLAQAVVGGANKNGNRISNGSVGRSTVTFTPTSESDYIHITFGSNGNNEYTFYDIQLEASSAVTDYAPYSNICPISGRDTVTITRTDGDGQQSISLTIPLGETVYGGTVDVVNGVLTVDRASLVFNGTETWTKSSTFNGSFWRNTTFNLLHIGANDSMCSHAVYNGAFPTNYQFGQYGLDGGIRANLNVWIMPPNSTLDDWYTYLATQYANGTPLTFTYKLATPITVTLTPQILAMLAGTNIIQSAEADNLSLTYKATN